MESDLPIISDDSRLNPDRQSPASSKLSIWLDRILAIGLLIFIIGLPFHLVIKKLLPGPVGTYWKEGLLIVLVLIWIARSILDRRVLLTHTILDRAILIYAGFILLRFFFDGMTQMAWWGLYISILYLPLVFIVPVVLRRFPKALWWLMAILVALGGILALGGVIEFITNRTLWPSAEFILRQGFPDVFIYGTLIRRVYFVLDSPTTLANTLALLLPIALVMVFSQRPRIVRIASGVASILMFTCILLTFSRGIWVAILLAALAVLVFKWLVEGNRKIIYKGLSIAAIAFVIFLLVVFIRPPQASSNRFTMELSKNLYDKAPVQNTPVALMEETPLEGSQDFQKWTLFDAIAQKDDTRTVLTSPLTSADPTQHIYRVNIPDSSALRFSIALDPETWSPDLGDGVNFKIFLKDRSGQSDDGTIFLRYINPKANPNDRRWRNFLVDLSRWGGKTVDLSIITEAGSRQDYAYDWAGWADLQIEQLPPSYFAANFPASQNPIISHLASIADWTRDETNRDRILAWRIGLSAWLDHPFWGNGLGSTGVASLRTIPEQAMVTESQLLKSLVELGIFGLLTWAFLWFSIGRFALRIYPQVESPELRLLLLGILCSLLIIFIDGLVYQNLEVKQVNALFWIFLGVLSCLGTASLTE